MGTALMAFGGFLFIVAGMITLKGQGELKWYEHPTTVLPICGGLTLIGYFLR